MSLNKYKEFENKIIDIFEFEKQKSANFYNYDFIFEYIIDCHTRLKVESEFGMIEEDYKESYFFLLKVIGNKNSWDVFSEGVKVGSLEEKELTRKMLFLGEILNYFEENDLKMDTRTGEIVTNYGYILMKEYKRFLVNEKIKSKETPEIVTIEETPEEKDAKVKFIILKELGIIDLLISQNYNNADIGKILEPITQIKKSYLENILTADFKLPDTTKDKTAYKRKNILRALSEFEKIGIDFKQLKYLPNIKKSAPHLFE